MNKFDAKNLPWLAALFQAVMYALAGSVYFGPAGWIIGGVAGVLPSLVMAYGSSRISEIAKKRKRLAYSAMLGLMLLSPLAVAPALYTEMTAISDTTLRALVAIVWAMLPDVSIVLAGAISGKSMVALDAGLSSTSTAVRPSATRSATAVRKSATALKSQCEALAVEHTCTDSACSWHPDVDALITVAQAGKDPRRSASSAKAGHTRNNHQPIQLDKSLLIKQERK